MKILIPRQTIREMRVCIYAARCSLHLSKDCLIRGDVDGFKFYRSEARECLANARHIFMTLFDSSDFPFYDAARFVFPKLPADQQKQVLQDEPVSEQVSAEPASPRLSLRGVLVSKAAPGAIQQPRRVCVQLVNFDGVFPNRLEFPRLGKHWAPPSVLVGNQERKGHSVLRP